MRLTSLLAIYLLFWALSLFLVLPWGVRTDEEAGLERQRGHAESAPHLFVFWRVAGRTTLVATFFFAIFYANYIYGWVTLDLLDWAAPVPR